MIFFENFNMGTIPTLDTQLNYEKLLERSNNILYGTEIQRMFRVQHFPRHITKTN